MRLGWVGLAYPRTVLFVFLCPRFLSLSLPPLSPVTPDFLSYHYIFHRHLPRPTPRPADRHFSRDGREGCIGVVVAVVPAFEYDDFVLVKEQVAREFH